MRLSSPKLASGHPLPAQGGVLPAVIIVVALALSLTVFFVFTRPALQEKDSRVVAPPAAPEVAKPKAPPSKTSTAASASKPPASAASAPQAPPAPSSSKPRFGFARPQDLGRELVRSLNAGDYERAAALASAASPSQTETAAQIFKKMLTELKVKLGAEDKVELLGMVENKTRLTIPLTLPGRDEVLRLQLDLEKDDDMGWKVAMVHLPKELATALEMPPPAPKPLEEASPMSTAGQPAAPTPETTPGRTSMPAKSASPKTPRKAATVPPLFTVESTPDALSFGSDFVRALLKHDFAAARAYVDEKKVPAERLAGLCIVFEEGQYEFKPARPMIITVANPEVSWIIAQVQSEKLQQSTEFGLELQRSGVDQPWKVVGLNLSEILSSFASSTSKLGVPYTPIVSNPRGGESLALYFEYDKAELHPRALKQLEIVAGLLNSDPTKKLRIAGHTDAKGTDSYNLNLSQSRAESVKKHLADMGVSAVQIVTSGLGKAQPLSPNEKEDGTDDPEGRSKNRRAEIYLDF